MALRTGSHCGRNLWLYVASSCAALRLFRARQLTHSCRRGLVSFAASRLQPAGQRGESLRETLAGEISLSRSSAFIGATGRSLAQKIDQGVWHGSGRGSDQVISTDYPLAIASGSVPDGL
jgi:hypothetical protein